MKRTPKFIKKLEAMLGDPKMRDVIERCEVNEYGAKSVFVIKNRALLGKRLGRYFCHSNYKSFTKQLCNYGFSITKMNGQQVAECAQYDKSTRSFENCRRTKKCFFESFCEDYYSAEILRLNLRDGEIAEMSEKLGRIESKTRELLGVLKEVS